MNIWWLHHRSRVHYISAYNHPQLWSVVVIEGVGLHPEFDSDKLNLVIKLDLVLMRQYKFSLSLIQQYIDVPYYLFLVQSIVFLMRCILLFRKRWTLSQRRKMAVSDRVCSFGPGSFVNIVAHLIQSLSKAHWIPFSSRKPRHSILPNETRTGFDPFHY